jgi:glutathione S-transferase
MLLYLDTLSAPNPRKVRLFMEAKGIYVDTVQLSMRERQHKSREFLRLNSLGQLPVLQLDDGTCICESLAICRYLEALHPEQPLFGRDAREAALVEMWIRRAEFRLWEPVRVVWRNDDARTEHLVPTRFADHGRHSRTVVADAMRWLDAELADGRPYLAGDSISMADIALLCGVDFAAYVGMPLPPDADRLGQWHRRASSRLSPGGTGEVR